MHRRCAATPPCGCMYRAALRQHEVGDIGLAGSKVKVGGQTRDGYHVFLGADLDAHRVREVVGGVAAEDAPAAVDAVTGAWESVPLTCLPWRSRDRFPRSLHAGLAAASREPVACGPEPEADRVPRSLRRGEG